MASKRELYPVSPKQVRDGLKNQPKLAKQFQDARPFGKGESEGRLSRVVDPALFHNAAYLYADKKTGEPNYDVWKDKEWTRDMEKRHPELRISQRRSTISVGWTPGLSDRTVRPRHRMAYDASGRLVSLAEA